MFSLAFSTSAVADDPGADLIDSKVKLSETMLSPLDSWGDWGELPPELEEAFLYDPGMQSITGPSGDTGFAPPQGNPFGAGNIGADEMLLNELDGSLISDPWDGDILLLLDDGFPLPPELDPGGR